MRIRAGGAAVLGHAVTYAPGRFNERRSSAMTRVPLSLHRIGLLLAAPLMLFSLVLVGIAVCEAWPLPACGASGIDPRNPIHRCLRVTVIGGIPVSVREAGSTPGLRAIEQISVSEMPDLRSSGLAFLWGLILCGLSCSFNWVLHHRQTALTGPLRHAAPRQGVTSSPCPPRFNRGR